MENALLIGLSRQMTLARELEVVANNIANINTTAFKADTAVFREFLMPAASHGQFLGADQRLSYVQDRATWRDYRPGPLMQTGNPLDIAIDGDAFLTVQTPRGERYTRNGTLHLNSVGELVTADGYQVLGDNGVIKFQPNDSNIAIANDGTIRVREGADTRSDAQRGTLRLVRFDQNAQLKKDGSTLFSAPAGVPPLPLQQPTKVRILQGALEQSNVRGVVEMSRMIEITRNYTAIAGLLQQANDMRHTAIGKLADAAA
jgi:flagellar basal-body rod protein FlgF